MIRHIVFWKFAGEAGGRSRSENLDEAATRLRGLPAEIREIRSFDVHRGLILGDRSYDLALLSTFDSLDDLRAYQAHPAHQEVVAYLRTVQTDRAVVDFEVS